jgi:restriction endonuclease Mrr
MDITYHYPPELFNLLVDTIPRLVRGKNDVLLFFRGAGVERKDLADIEMILQKSSADLNKFGITRTVLQRLNERGEAALRERREVLKRIVEFEDFSTCWESDQLKAKGLVAEIRRVVNVKDSFVRMREERDSEKDRHRAEYEKQLKEKQELRDRRQAVKNDLAALFGIADPQKRGRLLEPVLNNLFSLDGISVRESITIKSSGGSEIAEQIDGVISVDGHFYLVEMKWWNKPIGVPEITQHLSRLFLRGDVRGIYISASGYASTTVSTCRDALSHKTIILTTLEEFVRLLDQDGNLLDFLKAKVESAIIEKNPFVNMAGVGQ